MLLLVVCAVWSVSSGRRARYLSAKEIISLVGLFLLILIGIISGFYSNIQIDKTPVLIDIITCIKFPVSLLAGFVVFNNKKHLFKALACEAKLLLVVMLPFALINHFIDIGMRYDNRFGMHSFEFVFGHPGSLASVVAGFSVLFFADKKANGRWLALCWLYLILTLRSTAIAFAVISLFVRLFYSGKGHISLWKMALIVLLALAFGWSQILYYFFEVEGSARKELFSIGLQVADRYFPLGSGFATFASNITSRPEYYSQLYYQYGLQGIYGLSPSNPAFLSDSFIPTIVAQFGWLGLIVYINVLVLIFIGSVSRLTALSKRTDSVVIGFIFLCLSSVGSSAFFHPMAVYIAICITLASCNETGGIPASRESTGEGSQIAFP